MTWQRVLVLAGLVLYTVPAWSQPLLQVDAVADPQAPWLADAVPQYQAWLDAHQAGTFLQLVAPVFASHLDPARPLRVHLTAAVDGHVLRARTLADDLTVQVRQEDTPDRRAEVIVHEAVHALQQRSGMTQHLMAGLPPDAAALLDEALATALGQGLWRWLDHALDDCIGAVAWRRGRDRYAEDVARPWYTSPGTGTRIDAWARTLQGDVTRWVAYGTPLDTDALARTWHDSKAAANGTN